MKKPILTIYLIGFILLLGAATQPVLASDWPQFQKDEINSGITNDSAPIANPSSSESWVVDTVIPSGGMAGIDSTPIVYNGSVYAVTSEANLVKYSLDGTPAGGFWPVNFATAGTYDFQNGGMAACNGYIYLVDSGCVRYPDYDLYAIDADTGTIVDRKNVTDSRVQFSTPITYVNDSSGNKHILFGSVNTSSKDTVNPNDGGKYYCYNVNDPSNPVKEWERNCSSVGRYYWGYYWAGAAVIGNYAVYGDDNGHLVSVNYTNFANNEVETIQEINASDVFGFNVKAIRSSVSYSEETGRIYFTSLAGYCYSLGFNANTGQFNTASNWSSNIGSSTSTPAYYNGRVYVGNNNGYSEGNLWCLSASDGAEIWSTSVGPVQSSPAISAFYGSGNEYIYVTTNSGSGGIYCVNSAGSIVWHNTSVGSNKYCLAGAAISGGWVYYGNDDGYLLGLANYTCYDFAVGASENKWAYNYQVENVKPSTSTVPNFEFSTAEYEDIASCDEGESVISVTDTNGDHAAHRFVFKIDDNEKPWITSLNVMWCGRGWHDSADNGVYLYIWNHASSQYEELANSSTDANGCLSAEIEDAGNYIDASGNVTVLVVQKSAHQTRPARASHIETDYVKVVLKP